MKICMINFAYSPYEIGGSCVSVRIMAEALKKRGYDIFVITMGPYNGLKSLNPSIRMENGIKVYYFYPINVNNPVYTKKTSNFIRIFTFLLNFWNPHTYFIIKKILKKENPDIVHVNEVPFLSLSVYSATKSLKLPVISTIHSVLLLFPFNNLPYLDKIAGTSPPFGGYNLYEKISSIYRIVNRIIINNPDVVIFPSKAIKNKYLDYGFFKHSEKTVLPNMIEIDEYAPKTEAADKETFDIFYMGGLVRKKGGHTLIKAFRKIHDEHARLHIFGNGEDHVYFKKLAEKDKRIIFYGQLPNSELQKFYKIANVTVMPSECFESFGLVIVESFCAHIPVIGSNIGGIAEMIQERYNGFLFEHGNVEELTDILKKVINNKEKLKKMSENAFKEAKGYSIENNIHKLEAIYKEVLKSKMTKNERQN